MQTVPNLSAAALATAFVTSLLIAGLPAPSSLLAQQQNITFETLTIDDGLSTSFVTYLLQDRRGFIWIGTQDGLNRYDGYDFRIFRPVPGDTLSLSNSSITTLYEDSRGWIWIGTRGGGLSRFDPVLERFTSFHHDPDDPTALTAGAVWAVSEDAAGNLWIGTDTGLCRLTTDPLSIERLNHDPADPQSLAGDTVWGLTRSRDGSIWVGTDGGVCLLDPATRSFTCLPEQPQDLEVLDTTRPPVIMQDETGRLWIGTSEGLYRIDPDSGILIDPLRTDRPGSFSREHITCLHGGSGSSIWVGSIGGLTRYETGTSNASTFRSLQGDPQNLSNDNVTAILEDRTGVLWVGTDNGLSMSNPASRRVRSFTRNQVEPSFGLGDNQVWSIFEDMSGCIWFGTDAGLDCYDPDQVYTHHFRHDPADLSSLSHSIVMAIHETRAGDLLVGTRGGGLNRLDRVDNTFTRYRHVPGDPGSISSDFIYRIHEDEAGIIWMASGNGLNRFDPVTGRFTSYQNIQEDPVGTLSNNDIWAMVEDHRGYFWLGTWGGGLFQFNRASSLFTRYRTTHPESNTAIGTNILSLYEDGSGIIWVGALDGLHRFDPETAEFSYFSTDDGLPNNVIYGILEDDLGRLWLSTNRGLSRFDQESGSFTNFDMYNGLRSNEFNRGAYHRTKHGELLFGGIEGVSAFHPDEMRQDTTPPAVFITGLSLFNEPVPIGEGPEGRTILTRSISETDIITLSWRERTISISYTALHYVAPDQIEYAYILEGIDQNRNHVGNQRYVTYSNLSPDEYTFRVYASNHDGFWNEAGASLRIIITPPFTMTWGFRAIVIIAFLAALAGVIQYGTRTVRRRNVLLERHVAERTSELEVANLYLGKEVEVRRKTEAMLQEQIEERLLLESQIQQAQKLESMRVLAGGIAHDFNNLLTGVLGNAELVLMNLPEDACIRSQIEAIQSSAERAADLSMQMLAYSGKGLFSFEPLALSTVLQQMMPQIEYLIPDQIELITELQPDLPSIRADHSQITLAVTNLIINAVEAIAGERGSITISTGSDMFNRQYLSQTYLDEKLPEGHYCFLDIVDTGCGMDSQALNRIFDPFYSTKFTGRGLGLAATLGIIRGHLGAVRVDSIPGQSTHFRLLFPVVEDDSAPVQASDKMDRSDLKGRTVLLVDDEATVLQTGTNLLESLDLEVLQATGGQEAIDLYRRHTRRIDLLIVDMTMPHLNGVEVLEEVRRINPEVPVIIASGFTEDTLSEELGDERPSGFLQKPYTLAILKELLENSIPG